MSVVVTIRDVPEAVRDFLAQDARDRGQSLQAYLLALLVRQADFGANRRILVEIDEDLARGGGAGHTTPDAADLLARARPDRDRDGHERSGVA
ncbi:MAG TPA: hypothetical protein VK453_20045 [Micromonosporaceae bacterium]|nr:hypothetical protein [Micromonosporaceae bacterium]